MRALAAALLAVAAVTAPAAATPATTAAAATPSSPVSVTIDRPAVSTSLGREFGFTSTVRNDGDQPLTGLIAHLNILSVDPDVYVDPEDWSSERTQFLAPVPPGGAVEMSWRVQAVNSGDLVVYVAVTAGGGPGPVVASNPLRLTVTEERAINAGGVLPVAVGMPLLVLALMGATARRRRRLR